MAAITYDGDAAGRGMQSRLLARSGRQLTVITGTFDFDSSYPTGGESVSGIFDQFKSSGLFYLNFAPRLGFVFDVDYSGKKVLAYYADNNAAADSALIQVPDTTDLSAVTGVHWVAIGVAG